MTRKIGDTPKSAAPVKASVSKAKKTAKPAARAKAFGKKPAAAKQSFPRTTWQDTNKLGKEIEKSQAALARHPRIGHSKPNTGTPSTGQRPPIQMRYGLPTPKPPIQMRYGLPNPNPAKPPIQARYGLPTPNPNKPPIQMKYGLPRPNPDKPKPPIQMKYGLPSPNPDTSTKKT
jgi:hypothetical protein